MKITWLGHSGFRIEIADQILLVDPWLSHPLFDASRRAEATAGATAILVSHGHFDHVSDVLDIEKAGGIPVAGTYDLVTYWAAMALFAERGYAETNVEDIATAAGI